LNEKLAIEVKGLAKDYGHRLFFSKRIHALRSIDLEVQKGEVFALLGPNGAGKTTLIKILLGILRPTTGTASVLDNPCGSFEAKRKIGYLPENLVFPKHMTALAALSFYGGLSRVPNAVIKKRGAELLEWVGLKGRENELVRKYSKGMRQRLGIAQALLHDPEILILDEPTDGLDPLGRNQIRELVKALKGQGKTVFLNSHILQEVEVICDRVAILAQGEVRGLGTIEELQQRFLQTSPIKYFEILTQFHSNQAIRSLIELLHSRILRWDSTTNSNTSKFSVEIYVNDIAIPVYRDETPFRASFAQIVQEMNDVSVDKGNILYEVRLRMNSGSQAFVDEWIDLVRSLQGSIIEIRRAQSRLEDIFLDLVQ
jgi:ABC-2 type transport system ATP-binding protein